GQLNKRINFAAPPETVSGSNSASGILQSFPIHKLKKCIGDGNFEIAGLTNMSQMSDCSLACLEYGCAAINIHQTSKTTFACYILTRISSIVGGDGWACYYLPMRSYQFLSSIYHFFANLVIKLLNLQ
uniref:Apple domain-containing protein n=1 Tax=Ascaris lumbricoides TaxID=6252 RepID=A0A0M3IHZ7_ASCLU